MSTSSAVTTLELSRVLLFPSRDWTANPYRRLIKWGVSKFMDLLFANLSHDCRMFVTQVVADARCKNGDPARRRRRRRRRRTTTTTTATAAAAAAATTTTTTTTSRTKKILLQFQYMVGGTAQDRNKRPILTTKLFAETV